ncbi:MAG: hypothetical protein R2734_01670 [Nocardioides sp.]
MAGRLADAPPEHLALSGQGVRDVTRVAGSDPALWQRDRDRQCRSGGGAPHRCASSSTPSSTPSTRQPRRPGRTARPRSGGHPGDPGKHNGSPPPHRHGLRPRSRPPGRARPLFADAGRSRVNIEDVRIDHERAGRRLGRAGRRGPRRAAARRARSQGWVAHR